MASGWRGWSRCRRRKDAPSQGSAIYVAPVAAGPAAKAPGAKGAAANATAETGAAAAAPQRVTAVSGDAPHDEHGVSWSPDGTSLAFLSDAADAGQLELYVAPAAGGTARQLTKLKGYLATPQWSPDGQTVAILFTENAPRASGPLQPRTPDVGVVEDHYFEQRLTSRQRGQRRGAPTLARRPLRLRVRLVAGRQAVHHDRGARRG